MALVVAVGAGDVCPLVIRRMSTRDVCPRIDLVLYLEKRTSELDDDSEMFKKFIEVSCFQTTFFLSWPETLKNTNNQRRKEIEFCIEQERNWQKNSDSNNMVILLMVQLGSL